MKLLVCALSPSNINANNNVPFSIVVIQLLTGCFPFRLDWPVRTLSFSHDGSMLASGSEDLLIDVSHVGTGERVISIPVDTPTFTVAWHPRSHLLAYACDDKDDGNRDAGTVKLYGLSNE